MIYKIEMIKITLIVIASFFTIQLYGDDSSQCILMDSSSKITPNPREKDINEYLAFRENEAKKGNNLVMFSEPAMFYAILPDSKDTLTISQYLSHFDNVNMQTLNNDFSVSVSWDSKIYFVTVSCKILTMDSDRVFWLNFFSNIRARSAKINNIPSQMTTNFNETTTK